MGFTDEVNLILIGRLGKPVGLKGYINLIAHSDNPSGLSKYKEFFIDANGIHKFTLDKISKSITIHSLTSLSLLIYFNHFLYDHLAHLASVHVQAII